MPWLATLMIRLLLGLFPAFADEARSVPKSNVRAVNSAQIKVKSLNGDSAGTGQQNVCMPLDLTVVNASKARPEDQDPGRKWRARKAGKR